MSKAGRPKSQRSEPAEELAALCGRLKIELYRAGRTLHDRIGPLLSGAGLRLQLLKTDVPNTAPQAQEILRILNEAMEETRVLSRELIISPVPRGGLKNALHHLAQENSDNTREVTVSYEAAAPPPEEIALAIYDAVTAAVRSARYHDASRIQITARDSRGLTVRVIDNGRPNGRAADLNLARLLARQAGLTLEISTRKSTIVSIRYAARRPARG
jgi:signal transduction histidine kinase